MNAETHIIEEETARPIAQPPALEQACAGCGEVLNLAYPYAKLDPDGEWAPTHLSNDCFSRALEKRKRTYRQQLMQERPS